MPNAAPTLTVNGAGNYIWTFDTAGGVLNVYHVGAISAPAAFTGTYLGNYPPVLSGNTLAAFAATQVTTIDLSGSVPTSTTTSIPVTYPVTFAAIPGGGWVAGNNSGVLVDGASLASGQPRFPALGHSSSIVAGSQYFSVATAAGRIFTYDSTTNALVQTINFTAANLATSASGATIAAVEDANAVTNGLPPRLNVYSLPGGTLTAFYAYNTLLSPC